MVYGNVLLRCEAQGEESMFKLVFKLVDAKLLSIGGETGVLFLKLGALVCKSCIVLGLQGAARLFEGFIIELLFVGNCSMI